MTKGLKKGWAYHSVSSGASRGRNRERSRESTARTQLAKRVKRWDFLVAKKKQEEDLDEEEDWDEDEEWGEEDEDEEVEEGDE